jgi:uroporphyrinogen decarboxylase
MTSRERVEKAVSFQQTDRVPIDLGGMRSSGINVSTYAALKRSLGIATPTRVLDVRLMTAVVEEEVLRRLHADVMPVDLAGIRAETSADAEWQPRVLFDGTPALFPPGTSITEDPDGGWNLLSAEGLSSTFRMPPGGFYFDDTGFNDGGPIDPHAFAPEAGIPDEDLAALHDHAARLFRETDFALLGSGSAICFLGLSLVPDRSRNVAQGRPDEWMMMLLTEKETCHEMMGRAVDAEIQRLRVINEAVGDFCFAWVVASDDSGTQRGEFVSPDLWAEMIKPHYTRLCSWVHRNTRMKTFMHCCGSVPRLIPHFIDAGVDILNPVQTSAAGMEPSVLKERFAGRIAFWGGGCDTQTVLPRAAPSEVRDHVRERMRIFAPGAGFVFTQVHNIQALVPVENVRAMFDAALEFGRDPR